MQTPTPVEENTPPLAVDEHAVARALSLSVDWVRKDRRTKRLLPFIRIGSRIRYDLASVRRKLAELEEGGVAPRGRRRSAA